jgi:formate C-acetyltransferase
MAYEERRKPEAYVRLTQEAGELYLAEEDRSPSLARARALRHVVENCQITPEPDTVLLGGEDPFFFPLLRAALEGDRHAREGHAPPDEASGRLCTAGAFDRACFEGHITPGLEQLAARGLSGLRQQAQEELDLLAAQPGADPARREFYEAALLSCASLALYASRYREEAARLAATTDDPAWAQELREAVALLERIPEQPAETLREALQAYWLAYILVTLEIGGCAGGGGLGLGRPDQYLYPYYRRDLDAGRLTREQALELLELFLLCFRHVDYYTGHQRFTPGSHGSLGGVTPAGAEASNELTELLMEASLRIAMPAPYLSLRLHRHAPERYWEAAASYLAGGLGFPVVNDEALIPAFLNHGRSLADARDYICSCCYENTIPGREAFHPNGTYLNLPLVLELALNQGRSLLTGEGLGCATPVNFATFEEILAAFRDQLHYVGGRQRALINVSDRSHSTYRRYPLMSLFMDDCLAHGQDVCAGGARYNLTGCIVAGLPDVLNSLAAIRSCVFQTGTVEMADLLAALRADFAGYKDLRGQLLAAPKWGNDDERVDALAATVTEALYGEFREAKNARGGRWQLALYSFTCNLRLGEFVGASAEGRPARQPLTRNLNPAWGTDRQGPTAVLRSLSHVDFTHFPNGCALDLRFDPALFDSLEGRRKFAGFLRGFVALGVMQMQITMVDTATLLEAQQAPERFPHLMVKVAGYSARFVDLDPIEQAEILGRSQQGLG